MEAKKTSSREVWTKDIDFLFATIGTGVGLGNVWRFPYVCYRNGGGVFFIPYLVSVVTIGIPVVFLEGAYGQFMSKGVIAAWKICPLFQGIGVAQAILCFYTNCYYNIIIAWVLYYVFSSFTAVLPWSHCNNEWNTENCKVYRPTNVSVTEQMQNSNRTLNVTGYLTGQVSNGLINSSGSVSMDPATEYWERKVLGISHGVEYSGTIKWDLALCLLLAWVIVYFCIWKGIKLSGKISYVTVIAPYVLIVILLIRGATLPGAGKGIEFYLLPNWSKIGVAQVWVEAGIQVFFSYAVGIAIHTSLGSCNRYHHNILRHGLIFAVANSCTSFLAGFVVFSVLGFMADRSGLSVAEVAGSGPGLAFVAYPEAVSQMPLAPLWSCIFFVMLILVAIDSQFISSEALLLSLGDLLPRQFHGSPRKEISTAIVCAVNFLLGLSMVTKGGIYVEQLFEWYCAGRIIMFLVFLECFVLSYVYGISRLQKNFECMLGFRLPIYFKICWSIITPAVAMTLFIMDIILYPELTYNRKSGVYHFPGWAVGVGWALAGTAIVFIPGVMIYRLVASNGTFMERVRFLKTPEFDESQRRRDQERFGNRKDSEANDMNYASVELGSFVES